MKIILPSDFFSIVKDKHILLDTTVFIDALTNPTSFVSFLNQLKNSNVTFVTLDVVIVEFTRGAQDERRFREKNKFIEQIIETCLPVTDQISKDAIELANEYHLEGKGVSITDFLLGATLKDYKDNLLLMTRNTNDFPINIFDLSTCFNVVHNRGIFAYGLYSYRS